MADNEPVFIMDKGVPAYVLVSFETYKKLLSNQQKIADLLAMHDTDLIFNAPPLQDLAKPACTQP